MDYNFFIINKEKKNLNDIKVLLYHIDQINGISLANDYFQPFLFNCYDTSLFSYPHTQKDKNITINFGLNQNEEYIINIYLNKKEYKISNDSEYIITSNKSTILINSINIINECSNFIHICKVLLNITSINKNKTILYISVNTGNKSPKREEDKNGKEKENENKADDNQTEGEKKEKSI